MTQKTIQLQQKIPADCCGMRLDAAVSQLLPDYSRAQISKWIKSGELTVNGEMVKTKMKVKGFESLELDCTLQVETDLVAQEGPLDVVYEDEDLLIINKPAGWVVHPGAGNPDHTVVNSLLYYLPDLNVLPRAGIIHRLDKDTTGLLIVAKNLSSYHQLIKMMQQREIKRTYVALAYGEIDAPKTIDAPIGRHPTQRIKMAVNGKGKPAVTHIDVIDYFPGLSLLEVNLETGRTHQIRVHLTHIGFPLVGDQTYQIKQQTYQTLKNYPDGLPELERQALHAYKLSFNHPITQKLVEVQQDLPEDMQSFIDHLYETEFEEEDDEDYEQWVEFD